MMEDGVGARWNFDHITLQHATAAETDLWLATTAASLASIARSYDQPSTACGSATGGSSGSAAVQQYTPDVIHGKQRNRDGGPICVNMRSTQ